MASTAVSTDAKPVISTAWQCGSVSRIARRTSRPPTSGIRRSTITRSARRTCIWAIASLPTGTGDDVETGAARKAPDYVENALLVVDDQEKRSLRCHTYSLATERITARNARN